MATAAISAGIAAAPQIIHGAQVGYKMGKRYGPAIGGAVNHIFHKGPKSAKRYLKGLKHAKGWHKLITKDLPGVAKAASKAIASGKATRAVGRIARDAKEVGDVYSGVTGKENFNKQIDQGVGQFNHHHEVLEKYNQHAKDLHSQWTGNES